MESKVDEVLGKFQNGKIFNCVQAIFSTYCEDLGLDKETALKLCCGLGGGMGRLGYTCGAVSGAHLVIGLKHGSSLPGDQASKLKVYALVREFEKKFVERNQTTLCRELLKVDLLNGDKQTIFDRTHEICPRALKDAVEILESILSTDSE